MTQLSTDQTKLHTHALNLAKRHRAVEAELVLVLQKIDHLKLFKHFGKTSLFTYATEILGLEKSTAYSLITVARKSREVPELQRALSQQRLTLSKASRIVSSLNRENATHWIGFASTHTREELDLELAKTNPSTLIQNKMRPLTEYLVELKIVTDQATLENLKRVCSLEAQKGRKSEWGDALGAALQCYLQKNDPVQKAARAEKRQKLLPARVHPINESPKTKIQKSRSPLTAAQRHAVFLRDQGRCTHVDGAGHRCNQDRWLDIHHIISVHHGGTNEPENLTLLCSFHHDLVHQLSLPLDGQVSWLRSPQAAYG